MRMTADNKEGKNVKFWGEDSVEEQVRAGGGKGREVASSELEFPGLGSTSGWGWEAKDAGG